MSPLRACESWSIPTLGRVNKQYSSVGETVSEQYDFSGIGCIETVFGDVRKNGPVAGALIRSSSCSVLQRGSKGGVFQSGRSIASFSQGDVYIFGRFI